MNHIYHRNNICENPTLYTTRNRLVSGVDQWLSRRLLYTVPKLTNVVTALEETKNYVTKMGTQAFSTHILACMWVLRI